MSSALVYVLAVAACWLLGFALGRYGPGSGAWASSKRAAELEKERDSLVRSHIEHANEAARLRAVQVLLGRRLLALEAQLVVEEKP